MSVVSQEIDNLLGGVSQQPATLRDATEGEEQINMLPLIATGNSKRPPTQHSAVLSATPRRTTRYTRTMLFATRRTAIRSCCRTAT
jgi:hypothetical protein